MNTIFTFLFDINRHPVSFMVYTLYCLIKSLDYFNNSYELLVYTNVNFNIDNPRIKIISYDINNIKNNYKNSWHDLSYHKLILARELIEQGLSPMWLDLDTIVCKNIDHLSNYKNFFVKQGGVLDKRPFRILPEISVPESDYIQGNIWKVDKILLDKLMNLWDSMSVKPDYDSQGLFNYAYYFKDMNKEMTILGEDVDIETVNGVDITDDNYAKHPEIELLKDNLVMKDNKIIKLSSGKQVQFFTFTFYKLIEFFSFDHFSKFSDSKIKDFFKTCGYIL